MLGVTDIHATTEGLNFAFLAGAELGVNYFITKNIALKSTVRASFAQLNVNRKFDLVLNFFLIGKIKNKC
jgi:hypothetical protein